MLNLEKTEFSHLYVKVTKEFIDDNLGERKYFENNKPIPAFIQKNLENNIDI